MNIYDLLKRSNSINTRRPMLYLVLQHEQYVDIVTAGTVRACIGCDDGDMG